MSETNGRNGIRVPAWAVAAISAAVTVLAVGVVIGQKMENVNTRLYLLDVRMCRIEVAMHVPAWPTCNQTSGQQSTTVTSIREHL